jgi:hypothetical protein
MKNVTSIFLAAVALIVAGCTRSNDSDAAASAHGHEHGPGSDHSHDRKAADHAHADKSGAPHGGTPVQVGDHGFHLELVPDPVDGEMLAYVLDAHMEKEVRVSGGAFELIAKAGTQEHRLSFTPSTNAPNATADKTSVFSATATNLNSLTNFEGVIPKITLDGKTFENVKFSYPKGSAHSH